MLYSIFLLLIVGSLIFHEYYVSALLLFISDITAVPNFLVRGTAFIGQGERGGGGWAWFQDDSNALPLLCILFLLLLHCDI